jgi:hypothetical protein
MDPNEALRLVRESVGELVHADDDNTLPGSQVGQVVDAFTALDEWLQKGGFLPSEWRPVTGDTYFVEIVYNTDPEGAPVDESDNSNRTLHGPFPAEHIALEWMDQRTDGDTDVRDVTVGILNKVDPDRPFVNALPGEEDPRAWSTCRRCYRAIVHEGERWIDPEAKGDDRIWRETCDSNHEDRIAAHEPKEIT